MKIMIRTTLLIGPDRNELEVNRSVINRPCINSIRGGPTLPFIVNVDPLSLKLLGLQKSRQVKRFLAKVRIAFVAFATPVDGVTLCVREGTTIPHLAATSAIDGVLIVLREDGLIEPLVAHRIKL